MDTSEQAILDETPKRMARRRRSAEEKRGDRLRHSEFVGLREDKDPKTVVKEREAT